MNNYKKGQKSEKKAAKRYGGTLKPASGALWVAKGDISVKKDIMGFRGLLIQNKETSKKSYTLKLEQVKEIEEQALMEDLIPVFRISYNGEGVVALPEWVFEHLIHKQEESND